MHIFKGKIHQQNRLFPNQFSHFCVMNSFLVYNPRGQFQHQPLSMMTFIIHPANSIHQIAMLMIAPAMLASMNNYFTMQNTKWPTMVHSQVIEKRQNFNNFFFFICSLHPRSLVIQIWKKHHQIPTAEVQYPHYKWKMIRILIFHHRQCIHHQPMNVIIIL